MGKLFKGKASFGFAFNQTGAQPLDDRSVVQSYNDLLNADTFGAAIYNGMIVATIDEEKVYMLVDKTKVNEDSGWKEIGIGTGSMSFTNFKIVDDKITDATKDNIGQVIYITGGTKDYPAGPYIVTGDGTVSKLGIISGGGDIASIASDVETIKSKVSSLEDKDNELITSIGSVSDKADLNATAIDKLNGDVYGQDGNLALAKSSDVYTKGEIDGKLADYYVATTTYGEFVESTNTKFQTIDAEFDSLDDKYATITSVDAIATSVQTLSDTVDNKAAQADLNAATARIDTLETAVNTTIPETYATKTALQSLTDIVNGLPTYTITKADTAEDGFAASYKLMTGTTQVGATINIPKDMVVESGVVRKLTEDEVAADKGEANVDYIVLTLSNATDDKLYIKASSLVDIYKSGDYVTINDDKFVSVNIDSVYTYIEELMLSNKTFATPTEVTTAKTEAINAAATDATTKANEAKEAAIADTATKLADYTKTTDLASTYATHDSLASQKDELESLISTEDGKLDVRLQLVEEQLGLGNTGEGDSLSVSQQLANAIVDVENLKNAVGTKADSETPATGIYSDIDNLDNKLSLRISSLDDTVVKTISLNGTTLTPESGTITIDVVNEIKDTDNTGTALISLDAAKNYVDSKVNTINSSINTLETEKASIKLVTSDSEATATNVIYLVGNAKAPKVVVDGALHTLGSSLYAPIDKYASAEDGGLMAAEDKSKLDEIGAIDVEEIERKIAEINASI